MGRWGGTESKDLQLFPRAETAGESARHSHRLRPRKLEILRLRCARLSASAPLRMTGGLEFRYTLLEGVQKLHGWSTKDTNRRPLLSCLSWTPAFPASFQGGLFRRPLRCDHRSSRDLSVAAQDRRFPVQSRPFQLQGRHFPVPGKPFSVICKPFPIHGASSQVPGSRFSVLGKLSEVLAISTQ